MIVPCFEVNTDIELVSPSWEEFTELHEKRYGLAIAYVKSAVKGTSYSNDAMRLVVSEQGFFTQSRNFPAAFYGDMGEAEVTFISDEEAAIVAWEAMAHYRSGEAQSFTAIYSSFPADVFFGYRIGESERFELGQAQVGLPLHLRVMLDAPDPSGLLGAAKGIVIYQRTKSGEHLLLKAKGRRQPFPMIEGFEE